MLTDKLKFSSIAIVSIIVVSALISFNQLNVQSTYSIWKQKTQQLFRINIKPNIPPPIFLSNNKTTSFEHEYSQRTNFLFVQRSKRAIFQLFNVLMSQQKLSYKLSYLKLVQDFLTHQARSFLSTSKNDEFSSYGKILTSISEMYWRNQSKFSTEDAKLTEKVINDLLRGMKKFLANLKEIPLENDDVCSNRLTVEKEKIIHSLRELQSPKSCDSAQHVILFDFNREVGFGSIIHRLVTCYARGLALGYPISTESRHWTYSPGKWKNFFNNSLVCKWATKKTGVFWGSKPGNATLLKFSIIFSFETFPKQSLPALPADLVDKLRYCHEDLQSWFSGVLIDFIMHPSDHMSQLAAQVIDSIHLKGDYVALQIRSTDKKAEAALLDTTNYMYYLRNLSKVLTPLSGIRNIWVATDNEENVRNLRKYFGREYKFISLSDTKSHLLNGTLSGRYSEASLIGIYVDLIMMTKSTYLFGTMSSNVERLAYEMRSLVDPYALDRTFSLDVEYQVFQKYRPFYATVIHNHTKSGLAGKNEFNEVEEGTVVRLPNKVQFKNRGHWPGMYGIAKEFQNGSISKTHYIPSFKLETLYETF